MKKLLIFTLALVMAMTMLLPGCEPKTGEHTMSVLPTPKTIVYQGDNATVASLTDSGLTSGRIPIAGTGGLLTDDSDLSFSGDTLTATQLQVTNILSPGLMKLYPNGSTSKYIQFNVASDVLKIGSSGTYLVVGSGVSAKGLASSGDLLITGKLEAANFVYLNRGIVQTYEAHTDNDTLSIYENGSIHSNDGASETITFTLPDTSMSGLRFTFLAMAVQNIRIKISAANKSFYVPGGGKITDDGGADLYLDLGYGCGVTPGDSVWVLSLGNGDWFVFLGSGSLATVKP